MKAYRISEILYIVIAVISIKEAYALWSVRPEKAYLFLGFAVWLFLCISSEVITAKFNRRKPKWI